MHLSQWPFPEVLIGKEARYASDNSAVVVVPYIKSRPQAALPLPPSVLRGMEAGAKMHVSIPDLFDVLVVPLDGQASLQPEASLAQALKATKGFNKFDILMPESTAVRLDIQLLASHLVDKCREDYNLKSKKADDKPQETTSVLLVVPEVTSELALQVRNGIALGRVRAFVRTLFDLPANLATPMKVPSVLNLFMEANREEYPGIGNIKVHLMNEDHADVRKMGAFTAVARGTVQRPAFLRMTHRLELDDKLTYADVNFVGKGVTFDSGGISIKPSNNMHHMKGDLGGAAAAMGALLYAAMTDSQMRLRAFIPLCENMPGMDAYKPSDVLTAYNGKTIEVINTDAEGRLILADALAYSDEYLSTVTMDLATLTGACRVALGGAMAALFTDSAPLCKELLDAGIAGRDRVWQLPMGEEYAYMTKSDIADTVHLDGSNGGGTINGAVFLKEFVKHSDRWVHLDIANVAGIKGSGTSRPMGLLAKWIDARSAAIPK